MSRCQEWSQGNGAYSAGKAQTVPSGEGYQAQSVLRHFGDNGSSDAGQELTKMIDLESLESLMCHAVYTLTKRPYTFSRLLLQLPRQLSQSLNLSCSGCTSVVIASACYQDCKGIYFSILKVCSDASLPSFEF